MTTKSQTSRQTFSHSSRKITPNFFYLNGNREPIYTPQDLPQILDEVQHDEERRAPWVLNRKKTANAYYLNTAISFDIETTSEVQNGAELAYMYAFGFTIYDKVIIGRTWEEFIYICDILSCFYNLSAENRRIIVWVHNLSYEFQFLRKRFAWSKCFALSNREPLYAITQSGIEFRCSYQNTRKALSKIKTKVTKAVGDLDYSLSRNSKTPLSIKEAGYLCRDCLTVTEYIKTQISKFKDVSHIPLTATGYVRKDAQKATLQYTRGDISRLKITGENEYKLLKQAFAGGFTHANAWEVGKILHNVQSMDFTSSYPAVMVLEKYPMGTAQEIKHINSTWQLNYMLANFCCLFEIKLYNVHPAFAWDNIISKHKCTILKNPVINNGRVVSADELALTVTEVDYQSLKHFYKWDKMQIGRFYVYKKAYLPKAFVMCILDWYGLKTKLKGVAGQEAEYMRGKENVNSLYGMTVTDIVRDIDTVDTEGDWYTDTPSMSDELYKYNNNKGRFLFYPWGVWVTAYARRNLYTALLSCGGDYVYSDTDSAKVVNFDRHKAYFDKYNKQQLAKIDKVSKARGIPPELFAPETVEGVKKPLGVWDDDGFYPLFKTLGAKRYLTLDANYNLHLTVAGLPKNAGEDYLKSQGKYKAFYLFENGLSIPEDKTQKLTHKYYDEPFTAIVTDYLGNIDTVHEESYIYLCSAPYSLSLEYFFIEFLKSIQAAKFCREELRK